MTRLQIIGTLVLLVAGSACENPADGKPSATVQDLQATPAAAAPDTSPEPAGALRFNQQGSHISMVGSKVTGSHDVKVTDFTGTIRLEKGAPVESGSVEVVMDMASVQADHPKLTNHLKGDDFFLVSEHPKSRFKSTGIEKGGEQGATHTVSGRLTLRGVEKRISFPATITRDGDSVRVKSEFSINRKDFGVNYPGRADDLIRDQVLIKLDLLTE